jgi:hypothetical protein
MISGMEVKEDDDDFMNAVDYMFAGLEKRKPDCFAVKQYKKYKLASGKTARSILISCGARGDVHQKRKSFLVHIQLFHQGLNHVGAIIRAPGSFGNHL